MAAEARGLASSPTLRARSIRARSARCSDTLGGSAFEFAAFTPVANATGQPAMSVPALLERGGADHRGDLMGGTGRGDVVPGVRPQLEGGEAFGERRLSSEALAVRDVDFDVIVGRRLDGAARRRERQSWTWTGVGSGRRRSKSTQDRQRQMRSFTSAVQSPTRRRTHDQSPSRSRQSNEGSAGHLHAQRRPLPAKKTPALRPCAYRGTQMPGAPVRALARVDAGRQGMFARAARGRSRASPDVPRRRTRPRGRAAAAPAIRGPREAARPARRRAPQADSRDPECLRTLREDELRAPFLRSRESSGRKGPSELRTRPRRQRAEDAPARDGRPASCRGRTAT